MKANSDLLNNGAHHNPASWQARGFPAHHPTAVPANSRVPDITGSHGGICRQPAITAHAVKDNGLAQVRGQEFEQPLKPGLVCRLSCCVVKCHSTRIQRYCTGNRIIGTCPNIHYYRWLGALEPICQGLSAHRLNAVQSLRRDVMKLLGPRPFGTCKSATIVFFSIELFSRSLEFL